MNHQASKHIPLSFGLLSLSLCRTFTVRVLLSFFPSFLSSNSPITHLPMVAGVFCLCRCCASITAVKRADIDVNRRWINEWARRSLMSRKTWFDVNKAMLLMILCQIKNEEGQVLWMTLAFSLFFFSSATPFFSFFFFFSSSSSSSCLFLSKLPI